MGTAQGMQLMVVTWTGSGEASKLRAAGGGSDPALGLREGDDRVCLWAACGHPYLAGGRELSSTKREKARTKFLRLKTSHRIFDT